jgi:hypothetical protein
LRKTKLKIICPPNAVGAGRPRERDGTNIALHEHKEGVVAIVLYIDVALASANAQEGLE